MKASSFLPAVKAQYELLPYPFRQPQDEHVRLVETMGDQLDVINHYGFHGKRDFRDNFRCLVAGGGTGDAAIYLAQQLRHTTAEVVYLDLSASALQIARERAAVRQLTNIRWVQASLLDLSTLDLGQFDYINCFGVLHHLASPSEGLRCLNAVLKADGLMYLMLYGRYGRAAIYPLQALFKSMLNESDDIPQQLTIARSTLDALPSTNLLKREWNNWKTDLVDFGDAGIYDLLLHSQDVPFTVPDIYQLLATQDLRLVEFIGNGSNSALGYQPQLYIKDAALLTRLQAMAREKQQAIAELIHGGMRKHAFFVSRQQAGVARTDDWANVPCLIAQMAGKQAELQPHLEVGNTLSLGYKLDSMDITLTLAGSVAKQQICRYADGKHTLREIYALAKQRHAALTEAGFQHDVDEVFQLFNSMGWMVFSRRQRDHTDNAEQ